jgi:arylsulfatase A-like enzyme
MPADGGPSERNARDKPTFLAQLPEMNAAERAALTGTARQRAESIYVLDQQVGRLVATLKRRHEWRNTVLMFTSDNGYFMGEHRQRTGKIKAHEPSLRVPFLVTGPGIPAGATRYDPITTIDLPATILDLARARRFAGHPYDGASRTATFYGGDQGWTVPVLTEGRLEFPTLVAAHARGFTNPLNSIGVRTPRYSYIRYSDGERELYDLNRDANELRNVAASPRYRPALRTLERVWWRWKDCVGRACQAAMPAGLRATAAEERALAGRFAAQVRARYGVPVP